MDTSAEHLKKVRDLCYRVEKLSEVLDKGKIEGINYDLPPYGRCPSIFTIEMSEEHLKQLRSMLEEELNETLSKLKEI